MPRSITALHEDESLPIFPVGLLSVLEGCNKLSLEFSLIYAEQPKLSHPALTKEVLLG